MSTIFNRLEELEKIHLSQLAESATNTRKDVIAMLKEAIAVKIALDMHTTLANLPYNTTKVRVEVLQLELSEANVLSAKVQYAIFSGSTITDEIFSQFVIKEKIPGCLYRNGEEYDIIENCFFDTAFLTLKNYPQCGCIPLKEIFDGSTAGYIEL